MGSIKETEKKATDHPSWRIYVGLGNPGDEYERTYHNVGRQLTAALAGGADDSNWQSPKGKPFLYRADGALFYCVLNGYMNASGPALRAALTYLKIPIADALICHDDSDMTVGKYKIVHGQSSGGHKGVQSIIDTFHTRDFWRCKIGIRPAEEAVRQKAEEFVLKKIKKEDAKTFEDVFAKILAQTNNARRAQ